MSREFRKFLTHLRRTAPKNQYHHQVADAALRKGHRVKLIASGDGVFLSVKGQVRVPLAASKSRRAGLKVDI